MPLIDERFAHQWNRYVLSHPQGRLHHLYQWRQILECSLGARAYFFAAISRQGEWQGVLPLYAMAPPSRRLYSLPVLDYGGLLVSHPEGALSLLHQAQKLMERGGFSSVELRHIDPPYLSPLLHTRRHKVTFWLDLSQPLSQIWKNLKSTVRNRIRRAERLGMRCVFGKEELLPSFYEIFAETMHRHGTPVYPISLFQRILRTLGEYADILLVYDSSSRPIATAFLLHCRGYGESPWPASRTDLSFRPSDYLYWQSLQFLKECRGVHLFDFGRSSPHSGTYRFKKKWPTQEVSLHWQYLLRQGESLPTMGQENPTHRRIIELWKNLPFELTRLLGALGSRWLP